MDTLKMKTRLKVNVGTEENVIPTVEGCLKDVAGAFFSTQNVIRVHEWLRGDEALPLVLEAVKQNTDGTYATRSFGNLNVAAYPERWMPGQLLKLEQSLLAVPAVQKAIAFEIQRLENNSSEELAVQVSETIQELMPGIFFIQAFNASAMFFDDEIPVRACMENLDVLDTLCSCILTQRRKVIYSTDEVFGRPIPANRFNVLELDRVIGRIHGASSEVFFPEPNYQAKLDGLLDGSFFRQCAMAVSSQCTVPIPEKYIENEPNDIYFWAVAQLNEHKDKIPQHHAQPTLATVVNLFSKT
jgi:hypothetical protein